MAVAADAHQESGVKRRGVFPLKKVTLGVRRGSGRRPLAGKVQALWGGDFRLPVQKLKKSPWAAKRMSQRAAMATEW
jgi:hypothetical protein